MSSADTTAAKKAAGQLQHDLGDGKVGKAQYQEGIGMEKAEKPTGASGFETTEGAKEAVDNKIDEKSNQ